MINKEKFEKLLIKHKKTIVKIPDYIDNEDETWFWRKVSNQAKELVLLYCDFKCERCGDENNLTIHHLIERKALAFMDKVKYLTQRTYWANKLCLCTICHNLYHNNMNNNMGRLPEKYIERIKNKYKV